MRRLPARMKKAAGFDSCFFIDFDVLNPADLSTRMIILQKTEIAKIAKACMIKGNTCVPLKVYWTNAGLLKVSIAIATGKNLVDKKQTLKERDLAREAARTLANH